VEAGYFVGHQRRHVLRRPAIADVEQVGDARARLDEIVVSGLAGVGTFGAIACAVNIDDVFADLLEIVIAEAEALQPVHADVGEEHVRLLHQTLQIASMPSSGLEVEQDGALVAVAAHVDRAHARRRRRAGMAHDVARAVLDLDDVGAHVAQQLRRIGAEHHRRQVEDFHAVERSGRSRRQRGDPPAPQLRAALRLPIHGRRRFASLSRVTVPERRLSAREGRLAFAEWATAGLEWHLPHISAAFSLDRC
jgi:hypothetical protein